MADAAGVHLDADLTGAGLRDFDIDHLELRVRLGNADHLHGCHARDHTPLVAHHQNRDCGGQYERPR